MKKISPTLSDSILPKKTGSIRRSILRDKAGKGFARTRELVRRRDNHTCQICKIVWKEGTRRFDVHHLKGNCGKRSRRYDRIKDAVGLITLCHKCHLSLESVKKKIVQKSSARSLLRIRNKY